MSDQKLPSVEAMKQTWKVRVLDGMIDLLQKERNNIAESEYATEEILKGIVGSLDLLDDEDFFGTEGWRHFLLGED